MVCEKSAIWKELILLRVYLRGYILGDDTDTEGNTTLSGAPPVYDKNCPEEVDSIPK
jgi:hypothetical protein